jgi:hypothetical protein
VSQPLADALTGVIGSAPPDVAVALGELRNAAQPGNGYHLAHVGWADREPVARVLQAAADGYPQVIGDELRALAAGLLGGLRSHLVNVPGATVPPAEPAPDPDVHAGY